MAKQPERTAGFTLIEVMLAIAITATVMMTVGTTFRVLLEAREVVEELTESTEAGPRILNLIERDLRGLWTFNIGKNDVFRGRDMDVGSFEADRLDFLTTTHAVGYVLDAHNQPRKPTVCEVGYWLKQNPKYRDLMELWRREDPMVDRDILTQGTFQLVHDRIKKFKITYYKTLGNEAEPLLEWNSSTDDTLPRRIKIEFTIERRRGSSNVVNDAEVDDFEGAEKSYVRHFVLDEAAANSLRADQALLPVLPPEPEAEQGSGAGGPGAAGNGIGSPSNGGPGGTQLNVGKGGEGMPGGRGKGGLTQTTGERGPTRGQGAPPGGGTRGSPPAGGLPPGFNLGDLLRGGGGGAGGAGGLFGGGAGGRGN